VVNNSTKQFLRKENKMPNWCENTLEISGSLDKMKKLWEDIRENKFLLGVLRPEPNYEDTAVRKAFDPNDLSGTWWDWRVVNWGTKWDISADDLSFDSISDVGCISGFFDSAWSPPVEALIFYGSQNPDVSISLKYHESGMGFVGQLEFYKGQLFTNNYYEYGQCRTPEEVVQLIGADLDELFGITYGVEMEVED